METAVQWLLERVEDVDLTPKMWEQIKLTALKKEKEQIQNVFEHCWNHPNWKGEYDIKDMEDYLKNYNQNK